MRHIDSITKDGFSLSDRDGKLTGLALFSLRTALKAFFSTYQHMRYQLHLFEADHDLQQETVDSDHSSSYCEACAEAILHFQHFVELVCKELLQREHPLLAADASRRPVLLHKLLGGESIDSADHEQLRWIEFGEALKRLCTLIQNGRVGDAQLGFIVEARPWLDMLNGLRNRLWHRGTFILRYPALDELVGGYVLSFVQNVVALPQYSDMERLWKYRDLNCALDPIQEITTEFRHARHDLGKVAFLKELGRAAYENPLQDGGLLRFFDGDHRRRAKRMAASEVGEANVGDVRVCPVCGVESLVVYDDIETEGLESNGTYDKAWRYTWQVECACSTFTVNNHLNNPSSYSLPIEDYWQGEVI